MKSTELRIGNIVLCSATYDKTPQDYKVPFVVDAIRKGDIKIEDSKRSIEIGNIDPIPLTESWLLKFGFEKSSNQNNTHLHLVQNGNYFPIDKGKNIDDTIEAETYYHIKTLVKIPTVHQLQNLYFAMTGDEITIKS